MAFVLITQLVIIIILVVILGKITRIVKCSEVELMNKSTDYSFVPRIVCLNKCDEVKNYFKTSYNMLSTIQKKIKAKLVSELEYKNGLSYTMLSYSKLREYKKMLELNIAIRNGLSIEKADKEFEKYVIESGEIAASDLKEALSDGVSDSRISMELLYLNNNLDYLDGRYYFQFGPATFGWPDLSMEMRDKDNK